jgi:hypothetical protein
MDTSSFTFERKVWLFLRLFALNSRKMDSFLLTQPILIVSKSNEKCGKNLITLVRNNVNLSIDFHETHSCLVTLCRLLSYRSLSKGNEKYRYLFAGNFSFTLLREVFLSLNLFSRNPQSLSSTVWIFMTKFFRAKEKTGKLSFRSLSKLCLSLHRFLRSSHLMKSIYGSSANSSKNMEITGGSSRLLLRRATAETYTL